MILPSRFLYPSLSRWAPRGFGSFKLLWLLGLPSLLSAQITLSAFDFKRDAVWQNRDGSLGIVGNHKVTSGKATREFTGESARYRIEFNAVLERDGNPAYKVSVAGKTIKSGKYPYACGQLQCSATKTQCPDKVSVIVIGEVDVKKGDELEVWGESTYPCGVDHGAYCRWNSLKLTKVGAVSVLGPRLEIAPATSPAARFGSGVPETIGPAWRINGVSNERADKRAHSILWIQEKGEAP